MSPDQDPVVLAVDDDEEVLETYRLWLFNVCEEVRLAEDGESALDALDDAVGVVVLDRMMPGLSGREVLDRIDDREEDPAVVMLTAMDPDFDVVEMPFDAYLTKPTTKEELRETVDLLARRETYTEDLREYYSLAERAATLEAAKTESELDDHEGYQELQRRIDELKNSLGDELDLGHDEFVAVAKDL
ncbi:response regulator [Halorubrum gandharaense]